MLPKQHDQNSNILIPYNAERINSVLHKLKIDPAELGDNYLKHIISAHRTSYITTTEKNQLLMNIIKQQVATKGQHLDGIKYSGWVDGCRSCSGKGFNTVIERKMVVDKPCLGNKKRGILPCEGTGIKTSICLRCGGLKLEEILAIRTLINQKDVSKDIQAKYGHFGLIIIDTISQGFIKENKSKTFRVIQADDIECDGNNLYYYIPKSPCSACHGSGRFVHDRKNIKCKCGGDKNCKICSGTGRFSDKPIRCPGCGGKGALAKHLESTGQVKSFVQCSHCHGEGARIVQHVLSNLSDDVRDALSQSGLL